MSVNVRFKTNEFILGKSKMNDPKLPKKWIFAQKEFAEFKILIAKALKHRGQHRTRVLKEIDEFFCDKMYELMMRQRGYFTEVMKEKRALEIRLQSVLNEKSYLEDQNHDLRHELATKGVFSHSPASLQENAS